MAYFIQGNRPVIFLANPRTGSTAIANVLLENGAEQFGSHHCGMPPTPDNTLVVQTVRHHCDVLVSYWYKAQQGVKFDYFVNTVLDGENGHLRSDGFYSSWAGSLPNFVLLYENLDFEFENLCGIAGLPQMKIPRTPTRRPEGVKWQTMFTTGLRDKVFERYHTEMELYGYGNS